MIRTKGWFASVVDADTGQERRVSIDEARNLQAEGRIVQAAPGPHGDPRVRVNMLLIESRKLEPGVARDALYAQIRKIKRGYPEAFRDDLGLEAGSGELPLYRTHLGWILEVVATGETFRPKYLDLEDRVGILAVLDALADRSFLVVHVSEDRSVVETHDGPGRSTTSTEVVKATYLLRRS
jgi:hypothetical protein